jgi:hypothetical protein
MSLPEALRIAHPVLQDMPVMVISIMRVRRSLSMVLVIMMLVIMMLAMVPPMSQHLPK